MSNSAVEKNLGVWLIVVIPLLSLALLQHVQGAHAEMNPDCRTLHGNRHRREASSSWDTWGNSDSWANWDSSPNWDTLNNWSSWNAEDNWDSWSDWSDDTRNTRTNALFILAPLGLFLFLLFLLLWAKRRGMWCFSASRRPPLTLADRGGVVAMGTVYHMPAGETVHPPPENVPGAVPSQAPPPVSSSGYPQYNPGPSQSQGYHPPATAPDAYAPPQYPGPGHPPPAFQDPGASLDSHQVLDTVPPPPSYEEVATDRAGKYS